MKIKDLRRLETELDAEVQYTSLSPRDKKEYSSLQDAQEAGASALNFALTKIRALNEVKYDIRETVRIFNETKGINAKTLKIAQLEAELSLLESVQNMSSPRSYSPYGSTKIEYQAGIDADTVDQHRIQARRVRREIQSLKDSCNGINSSGTAELSEKSMGILKKYGMID